VFGGSLHYAGLVIGRNENRQFKCGHIPSKCMSELTVQLLMLKLPSMKIAVYATCKQRRYPRQYRSGVPKLHHHPTLMAKAGYPRLRGVCQRSARRNSRSAHFGEVFAGRFRRDGGQALDWCLGSNVNIKFRSQILRRECAPLCALSDKSLKLNVMHSSQTPNDSCAKCLSNDDLIVSIFSGRIAILVLIRYYVCVAQSSSIRICEQKFFGPVARSSQHLSGRKSRLPISR